MSKIFIGENKGKRFSLSGPMIGAPYSTLILENLICRGARRIIYFGWCGAISESVKTGDIIIPTSSFIDEGTSKHYQEPGTRQRRISNASDSLTEKIISIFRKKKIKTHKGSVWTTDAAYRETEKQVKKYRRMGALAVEMELSALFSVGSFREVDIGAILVVSDELSSMIWKPGFKTSVFRNSCVNVCEVITKLCREN